MLNNDALLKGETREGLKNVSDIRAAGIVRDIAERTKHIGGTARDSVMTSILSEVLLQTYLEGRLSAIADANIREAREAREREAMELVTLTLKTSVENMNASVFAPIAKTAKKAMWWLIGIAAVEAATIATLAALLLGK